MTSLSYRSRRNLLEEKLAQFQSSGVNEENGQAAACRQSRNCEEEHKNGATSSKESITEGDSLVQPWSSRDLVAMPKRQSQSDFRGEVTDVAAMATSRGPILLPTVAHTSSTFNNRALNPGPSFREDLSYFLTGISGGGGGLHTSDGSIRAPRQNTTSTTMNNLQIKSHAASFTNLQFRPKPVLDSKLAPSTLPTAPLERWIVTDGPWNNLSMQRRRSSISNNGRSACSGRASSPQDTSGVYPEAHVNPTNSSGGDVSAGLADRSPAQNAGMPPPLPSSKIKSEDTKSKETVRSHTDGTGHDKKTRTTSGSDRKCADGPAIGNKHGLPGSSGGDQGVKKRRLGGQRQIKSWTLREQYDEGQFACHFAKVDPKGHPKCHTFSREDVPKVKSHLLNTEHDGMDATLKNMLKHAKYLKRSPEEEWFHLLDLLFPKLKDYRRPKHPWKEDYVNLAINQHDHEVRQIFEADIEGALSRYPMLSWEIATRIAVEVQVASSNKAMNVISPVASNNLLAVPHDMYGSSGQDSGFMSSEPLQTPDMTTQSIAGPSKRALDSMDPKSYMMDPPEPSESSYWTTNDQPNNLVDVEFKKMNNDDIKGGYMEFFACDEAEPDDHYAGVA